MHQHQEASPSNPTPLLHGGETPHTDPFGHDFRSAVSIFKNVRIDQNPFGRKWTAVALLLNARAYSTVVEIDGLAGEG